jgi:hypothetical protein
VGVACNVTTRPETSYSVSVSFGTGGNLDGFVDTPDPATKTLFAGCALVSLYVFDFVPEPFVFALRASRPRTTCAS